MKHKTQNNPWFVIRVLFVFASISLFTVSVKAQDLIVTQTGETIKAYRTDVGEKMVYYQLEDAEDAAVLKIQKEDVLVIKLRSGEVIYVHEEKPRFMVHERTEDIKIMLPTEPVADPERIASAQIGSLIEFYDGTKGVVFYLDGNGHGLAVYLYSPKDLLCWQGTSTWHECVDIESIRNERRTEMQMGLGAFYCDAAIKQLGLEELPAIKWCRSIGPDWYLPSLGELYELLVVANLSQARLGPISQAIKENGGDSFFATKAWYLSSSEDDDTNVYAIFPKGNVKVVKKYNPNAFRAIRMF